MSTEEEWTEGHRRGLRRFRWLQVAALLLSVASIGLVLYSTIVAERVHLVYLLFTVFAIATQIIVMFAHRGMTMPGFLELPLDEGSRAGAGAAFEGWRGRHLRQFLIDVQAWDYVPHAEVLSFEQVREVVAGLEVEVQRARVRVAFRVWCVLLVLLLGLWLWYDLYWWASGRVPPA